MSGVGLTFDSSNQVDLSSLTYSQKGLLKKWLDVVIENSHTPFKVRADKDRVAILSNTASDHLSVESFNLLLSNIGIQSQISYRLSSIIMVSALGAREIPMIEIVSMDTTLLEALAANTLSTSRSELPANDAENKTPPSMSMPNILNRHFSRFNAGLQAFIVDTIRQEGGTRGAGFFQKQSTTAIPTILVRLPNQDMFGGEVFNLIELLLHPQNRGSRFFDPLTGKNYLLSELSPAPTERSHHIASPSTSLSAGGG